MHLLVDNVTSPYGIFKFDEPSFFKRKSSSTSLFLDIQLLRFRDDARASSQVQGSEPVVTSTILPVESLADSARLLSPLPRQVLVFYRISDGCMESISAKTEQHGHDGIAPYGRTHSFIRTPFYVNQN